MKRQTLFRAMIVIAVILLFAATLSLAQEGAVPAFEQSAPDAAVGTAFTYQGQLEDGAGPINDSCDFEFALYDDAVADGQVGSTLVKTATVSDGLFSVALDFGAGAFDGEARWLEIAACCPSTCTPTTLDPRQELTPAPYALYAPPSDIKQLIQEFVVASGESVTAGDVVQFVDGYVVQDSIYGEERVFNSDSTDNTWAEALSPTKFVVAYRDDGNSSYGTAVIGDVSGTTITYGSEYVFNAATTYHISVAALSPTKFVVAYSDWGNSEYGTAMIGDVSGTTITYNSEYVFNSGQTTHKEAAALSPTQFVVAYRDDENSGYGTAVIGDVSDATITYGSEYVFNFAGTYWLRTAVLTDKKYVVTYQNDGNSGYGTAVVGDISGTVISYGPEYVFNSAYSSYISAAALSDDKFVVAYRDDGNSMYGTAAISDVSDNTITSSSKYVYNFAETPNNSVAAFSSTRFAVMYNDGGNLSYGTTVVGDVSDGTVTFGPEYVFNTAETKYVSNAALSEDEFVVAYQDLGNSSYGTAVIASPIGNTVGIARVSKTEGDKVPVIISGVSDVHSGLTPGEIYYSRLTGGLTTSRTPRRVGLAISDTELLLDMDIY